MLLFVEGLCSHCVLPVQVVENIQEKDKFNYQIEWCSNDSQASASSVEQIDELYDKIEGKLGTLSEEQAEKALLDHNRIISDELREVEEAY